MPMRPPVHRPPQFGPPEERTRDRQREHDARRGSAHARGYGKRWQAAAAGHLRRHPLCAYCQLEGRVTPASEVDHLYPHKGDMGLFWRALYWVSACAPCHAGFKQSVERKGKHAIDALARRLGLPPLDG